MAVSTHPTPFTILRRYALDDPTGAFKAIHPPDLTTSVEDTFPGVPAWALVWCWLRHPTGQRVIPEMLALLLGIMVIRPAPSSALGGVGWVMVISLLLRWSWQGAMILHGLGHTITRAWVDGQGSVLRGSNILEHRPLRQVLTALGPMSLGLGADTPQIPWLGVGDGTPWKVRVKAGGGLLFNLMGLGLGLCLGGGFQALPGDLLGLELRAGLTLAADLVALTNGVLLVASRSDWLALLWGQGDRLYCGNFGFVSQGEPALAQDLISSRGQHLFATMGRETEVRGEQAGGGLVFARDQLGYTCFVGHKLVKAKRGNLTNALATTFDRVRRRARKSGLRPMPKTLVGAWHYRFGTSGPPSILETHWHEWSPARIEQVWCCDRGYWQSRPRLINHRITHNGDFDGWLLFGGIVDYVSLGLWLERVLHVPNPTIGDSPKIAAMLDLLVTQGLWMPSVRLAYQMTLARSLCEAFGGEDPSKMAPSSAPSPDQLQRWADQFEAAFMLHGKTLPPNQQFPQVVGQQWLEQTIHASLGQDDGLGGHPPDQVMAFIHMTLEVFLRNDLYRATRLFMGRAQGSFGLAVLSTLHPDRVVLSSLGQPMSLGFDPNQSYTVYASEPAAVDRVLHQRAGAYRLDLNQNTGEVAVLTATAVTVYSMTENRELRDTELFQRRIPYPETSAHGLVSGSALDPVAQDLQDIPHLFRQIKNTWMNPASGNRQSAEYLANFLIAKARYLEEKQEQLIGLGLDPALAKSSHVDLLITGVENSLWVGEQFARDLKRLFPLLSVQVLSSNLVLQRLQYEFCSLGLAKQSLVFAITQSGQTFPTRQVLQVCDLLVRQNVIREFFLLTGEPTSFLGSALLAPTLAGEPFSRRLFTNGSERRVAEPATATVVATHQTLTELLLYLTRQLQLHFPHQHPLGLTLCPDGLALLDDVDNQFLRESAAAIFGDHPTPEGQSSQIHRQLVQAGQRWGLHIIETPLVWGIHALYVTITVGWALVFGYTIPLAHTLFRGMLGVFNLAPDTPWAIALGLGAQIGDIGIYILGPWLWTLGLRWWQRRPLLARTGRRTLVLGETPWVSQILENYISKLFSLSYGIATLEIHGANSQDDFVHRFAHRVARGTLVFLGVPDGRWGEQQRSAENAVILSGRQANGIRSLGVGPEVVALGSNPAITRQGFTAAWVLPSLLPSASRVATTPQLTSDLIEALRESRFHSLQRLLASYLFFWALARRVATFPLLGYSFWKSQSRTKIMTTAAPMAAPILDRPEPEEMIRLDLGLLANKEQS